METSLDFGFSEDQESLRDLATKILTDLVTHDRLTEIGATEDWFDRRAWQALADAGLLGIGLPEAQGGGGLGFLEVCIVAEQIGATRRTGAVRADGHRRARHRRVRRRRAARPVAARRGEW